MLVTSDPVSRYVTERSARFDRRARLRPMANGEVIDASFRMFQVLGWTFLRLSVVPVLFCMAALAFLDHFALPGLFQTSDPNDFVRQLGEVALAVFLALFVGGPLFLIGVSTVTASVTHLVSDYMVGNVPDERAAQAAARRVLPRLVALNVRELLLSLSGVLAALGLLIVSAVLAKEYSAFAATSAVVLMIAMVAFVPAGLVFLYVRVIHSLGPTILILEKVGLRDAAKRSRTLVNTPDYQGTGMGAILGIFFVCAFVVLLLNSSLSMIDSMIDLRNQVQAFSQNLPVPALLMQAYDLIPMFLSLWVVLPLWAATMTVLYYDRRIRLEGYDIEALAGDVWRADKQSRFQL